MSRRRRTDRDRRSGQDRRHGPEDLALPYPMRFPSWSEQLVQYLTRYLFFFLGLLYFNAMEGIEPTWMTPAQLNAAYAVYFVINTANFVHASLHHVSPTRFRFAMWVDIVITTLSVLNDPYEIPPSLLVFIMVVLGNGMRYGMRLFGEALVASFAAVMLIFSLRYSGMGSEITPGIIFLNLFGGIILLYAYILMGRIERSRTSLEHKSRIDTLTGLMNRRALLETAESLFDRSNFEHDRFVVMFADLDRFKDINDTHGHAAGDEVLRRFAGILTGTLRETDHAGRMGGDEFVVILTDTSLEEAVHAASRIQKAVRSGAEEAGLDYSVTIGIGEAPSHGRTFDRLLEHVDQALYRGKVDDRGGIRLAEVDAA